MAVQDRLQRETNDKKNDLEVRFSWSLPAAATHVVSTTCAYLCLYKSSLVHRAFPVSFPQSSLLSHSSLLATAALWYRG